MSGNDFKSVELKPLQVYILFHLRRANIDYAKSIARTLKMEQQEIEKVLKELEDMRFIERTHGSAIKRSEARFKLSHEVRKHHTYYGLTKDGEHTIRSIRDDFSEYLAHLTGCNVTFPILQFFRMAGCEHAGVVARAFSMRIDECRELLAKLVQLGLLVYCDSKVLKRKHRKAKAKKETRTHHRYYRLSRLAEMLLRYAD
ncbi:DUF2250 domain-containing protein [Archaeoglobus veneficus]|uniref:DUF2250 domain-containing protein n=1 Tax=Archaeoglobus veneficus (strain DSM 11195 / SNP6) TaxID=693661 RepID=F2KN96_ARCVS|nr:DUF2250 domain-containing protein [Archaeoglobus veneficus]AEA46197.1 Protein of unknown function DUF2250 [Archaeoglobus veneficus SNP6]